MVKNMKKHLKLIRNENGQVLLFVLISASITIVLFIGAVKVYMGTIEESRFLLEQIEVETIVQMSKVDLLSLNKDDDGELRAFYHYIYPNGDIHLKITQGENSRYSINNEIMLKNKSEYQSAYELELELLK